MKTNLKKKKKFTFYYTLVLFFAHGVALAIQLAQ